MIRPETILEAPRKLNIKAAIEIPKDVQQKVEQMAANETNHLSKYVLWKILENYDAAINGRRFIMPRYTQPDRDRSQFGLYLKIQAKICSAHLLGPDRVISGTYRR